MFNPLEDVEVIRASLDDCDLICDLLDGALRNDAHFPPKQLKEILQRPTSEVWIIMYKDLVCGIAIMYIGRRLHNIFISDWARNSGVGSYVLSLLNPAEIRVKTNMSDGDPSGFYEKSGYCKETTIAEKPHISVYTKQVKDSPVESDESNQSNFGIATIGIEELKMLRESHEKVLHWRRGNRERARRRAATKSQLEQGITTSAEGKNPGNCN